MTRRILCVTGACLGLGEMNPLWTSVNSPCPRCYRKRGAQRLTPKYLPWGIKKERSDPPQAQSRNTFSVSSKKGAQRLTLSLPPELVRHPRQTPVFPTGPQRVAVHFDAHPFAVYRSDLRPQAQPARAGQGRRVF